MKTEIKAAARLRANTVLAADDPKAYGVIPGPWKYAEGDRLGVRMNGRYYLAVIDSIDRGDLTVMFDDKSRKTIPKEFTKGRYAKDLAPLSKKAPKSRIGPMSIDAFAEYQPNYPYQAG